MHILKSTDLFISLVFSSVSSFYRNEKKKKKIHWDRRPDKPVALPKILFLILFLFCFVFMYTVFHIARHIWNPAVTVVPELWNGQNVTLFCKASNLAYHQLYLYHWVWKLRERELKQAEKHRIYHRVDSPNSCNQSDGITHLHISNVSKLDIGQYKCVLLMPDMKIAEDDVVLSEISKLMHLLLFLY